MIRTALVSLLLLVSLTSCSASTLRKSLFRRQADAQFCQAIEGFDCKCSSYRVTCTNDRELSPPLNIAASEKGKYQSVELVIAAARDITVNDQSFDMVKDLYKPDADNVEFRIKFEKFTGLELSSASIFNRVFPEHLPANTRKHIVSERRRATRHSSLARRRLGRVLGSGNLQS
jgi:hypothetical protein